MLGQKRLSRAGLTSDWLEWTGGRSRGLAISHGIPNRQSSYYATMCGVMPAGKEEEEVGGRRNRTATCSSLRVPEQLDGSQQSSRTLTLLYLLLTQLQNEQTNSLLQHLDFTWRSSKTQPVVPPLTQATAVAWRGDRTDRFAATCVFVCVMRREPYASLEATHQASLLESVTKVTFLSHQVTQILETPLMGSHRHRHYLMI